MSVRVVLSELNELARQNVLWSEHKYQAGSEIFREAEPADHVYQIRLGSVRMYKRLSDGRRQVGAFHLAGDIFGFEDGEFHQFAAGAIVDTWVRIANRQSLFAGFAEGGTCCANKVRDLVTRTLERVENHLLLLGRQRSLEKVAAFLVEMDRRFEQPRRMVLPMYRCDIADYLGMKQETVARALSVLRDEGILSFVGRRHREIVLHDRSRLSRYAMSLMPVSGLKHRNHQDIQMSEVQAKRT